MSSLREEKEKRRFSRHDVQIENIKLGSTPTISTEHRHVPNYMRPTISSTLSQKHPSISSSSTKETLIRRLFDKSSSPCPRLSRRMSLSFDHSPSSPLVPCSPRKSRNQEHSSSKEIHNRVSSLHDKKSSGNRKGVSTISRTSSCIAFNQATVATVQETRIEDHHDRVVEDNEHGVVVEVNRCDYDSDKIFDEVQAMVLEDYNRANEIPPEIVEDDMEHIGDIPKDNHDHKRDEHEIDTISTNEIHDDIEYSNEVHPLVFEEVKVHIENLQLDCHDQVEDVDEENIVMVHADNRDQPSNYEDQDETENSREILSTMAKEEEQPYHYEKQEEHRVEVEDEKDVVVEVEDEKDVVIFHEHDQEECHQVEVEDEKEECHQVEAEDEKDAIVEVEDKKDAIDEVEDEKDVVIVGEDDKVGEDEHDQPLNYMKQDNIVDFGDHIESSSTILDANEEKEVSSFDELNVHQNQEQVQQQNERKQGEDEMTSTDVPKEVIRIEIEQEATTMKEQEKEPTLTQANVEQDETKVIINKRLIVKKKETAMAYNDVIEETRSKLLQDKKNKVKALVGAFETVMSIDKQ